MLLHTHRICTEVGETRAAGYRYRLPESRHERRSIRATCDKLCLVHDLSRQLTAYEQARAWQHCLVDQVLAAADRPVQRRAGRLDTGRLLLVQHFPVYTLGAGSTLSNVHFNLKQPPHPLYRTERGGEVTYHGPGQLVLYPILNLRHFQPDLHWYLRKLEEVVIRALEISDLQGERVAGMTGIWVKGLKIAAIGVRAKRWVTYHGLALNVCMDLQPFEAITPCGLVGMSPTSVELANAQASAQAGMPVESLIPEYAAALLDAFSAVFHVHLLPAEGSDLKEARGTQPMPI